MSGVKSLLILILVDHVLSGDLSRVAGADGFRRLTESLFGPLSTTGLASQLYGYANALIYISIPLGGLVGDVLARRRLAVFIGGGGMLAGLVLMLGYASFLAGLGLFAIGTGILKGNLSAQVGILFADEARRRQGYATYLAFLNAGVIGGPLVCGGLATLVGWPYAIAAAGIALAIGLACYAATGQDYRPMPPVDRPAAIDDRASGLGQATLLITALVAIFLCYSAYDQLTNIFLLWARTRIDLAVFGWQLPVPWFLSLDGLFTLLLIAVSQAVFRTLERRGIVIGALHQILMGGLTCAAGYLVLALGNVLSGEAPLPMAWALIYLLLIDSSIVLIWPSGLSLIAGTAPRRRVGFWVGLFYLHGFFASLWAGLSGAYYGRLAPTEFWLAHAAIAGMGALLVLVIALPLTRVMRRGQATITSA